MGEHTWTFLLQHSFEAVLVALVLGWLARSRLSSSRNRPGVMGYPIGVLLIGVVCFALFSAGVGAQLLMPNNTVTWWTIGAVAALALGSLVLIAAYFVEHHELSPDGVSLSMLFSGRKHLRWAELRSVRYSSRMSWFRLETQSGAVGRVSTMMARLPEFAQLLLAKAPREAIDGRSLALLEASAAGRPPPIGH
jgi:hypothetical protein